MPGIRKTACAASSSAGRCSPCPCARARRKRERSTSSSRTARRPGRARCAWRRSSAQAWRANALEELDEDQHDADERHQPGQRAHVREPTEVAHRVGDAPPEKEMRAEQRHVVRPAHRHHGEHHGGEQHQVLRHVDVGALRAPAPAGELGQVLAVAERGHQALLAHQRLHRGQHVHDRQHHRPCEQRQFRFHGCSLQVSAVWLPTRALRTLFRMPALRKIIHLDMDAFYASVEQRDDPSLKGKPVAVGGSPQGRGVGGACSYEARKFGIHSAMPMARAVRACPELVIVRPNFAKYREVSQQVMAILRSVTPLVEPLSLDEAYLDVTEHSLNQPLAMEVAKHLKSRIFVETALTASAGVAPNKFLAKIASGWQKPNGLTVIAPERVETFLQKLPVEALWGVGPVTAKKLRAIGVEKLVDVREADEERLNKA